MQSKILYALLLLLLGAVSAPLSTQAQDPHFSQFYAAPVYANPALNGVFNGRFRVGMNYREQWNAVLGADPFRTMAASFEIRHAVGRNDFMSYSLQALRDEVGTANYQRMHGHFGLSYMKKVGGAGYRSADQYLIAGAQVGAGQHGLELSKLWFSSQFDPSTGSVDPSLPSNENLTDRSDTFIDFNAGLMWYMVIDDNASVYLGGAMHHLNKPQISFEGNGSEALPMRWTGQVGGEIPFSKQFSMLPAFIVYGQGPALNTITGLNLRYNNRDWREVAIRVGVWGTVNKKATSGFHFPGLIFSTILEMDRWNVGVSYDVNSGKLAQATNARGALELSLIYVHPATQKVKVKCPKL